MKNKPIAQFCLALVLSSFTACYYDVESELYPSNAGSSSCDTIVATYNVVVKPLIAKNCAITGCHISGTQLPDLSSYNGLKAAIERVKTRALTEKSMPPSGAISICDQQYLQNWINAGSNNN
jgi:hypothetical protein